MKQYDIDGVPHFDYEGKTYKLVNNGRICRDCPFYDTKMDHLCSEVEACYFIEHMTYGFQEVNK